MRGEVCQVGVRGRLNCCGYICGDGIMWEGGVGAGLEGGWSWLEVEVAAGRTDRWAQRGGERELEW